MANGQRIEQDIQALYRMSAPCEEGCTRLSYTPAHRKAVDFRSPEQRHIDLLIDFMHSEASRIQQEYDVAFEIEFLKGSPPVDNDPKVVRALQSAVDKLNYSNLQMDSGAGHDAMFLGQIWPADMILVPSRGGVTHCPEEFTEYENLAKGADVLLEAARIIDRSF